MQHYDQYTKEELIARITELEAQAEHLSLTQESNICSCENSSSRFKGKHGTEVLDVLPDMLSVFDHNYNFIALASSEHTVHVGGSSENLIGKNLTEILPPGAYEPVKKNFDKVLETKEASIGYHNLYVDDSIENFENRVIPINDKYILCICRNITNTVKAQNELQMVTMAVNNSVEEIYAVQMDGTLVFANKQFMNRYGVSGDLSAHNLFNIFPNITEQMWQEYIDNIKNNKSISNIQSVHTKPDGHEVPVEISAYILKDYIGQDVVWTIARDISERIEQENKIHELNLLMETILYNIPVYLFVKDAEDDFRYIYWNKEFEKSSGISASKVIGRTDAEVFPDKQDAEKFRNDDLDILRNNKTVNFEENYLTVTGERRIVQTTKTIANSNGKKPLLIGISWDVTQQKETEQALIKAREKAEGADKLKTAFLANMSHEIRTPLNAIVGFSKLMAETDEADERIQYADIVDKNTELLLQLINDILDLSKIEAGMLEFTEKPVELDALCQKLYESLLPRTQPGVRLVYDEAVEKVVTLTDSNRLAQVISNLLSNSQKFTRTGEIHFGFRKKEEEWIEFYVRDTGMGIAPENIDKIFDRFIKLNNFVQGTGLGLPICSMIVGNLGGKIWVNSEINKGTEFCFTLPWHQDTNETVTIVPQAVNRKICDQKAIILVAEDVESNYLLLKTLLDNTYRLVHAHDGIEAVKLFGKESPDLILMDIKMPRMDGLEATRLIRQQSPQVPIIALTAFAYPTDRKNSLEAGCNDFLVKPVSVALLRQILEKYI